MNKRFAMLFLLFSSILFVYATVAEAASPEQLYSEGERFLTHWKYDQALFFFTEAAEAGHAGAQCRLGQLYMDGSFGDGNYDVGVTKDAVKAVFWYQKAAEQGNDLGQFRLAQSYEFGNGVIQDYDKAVSWYRKAAEQGNGSAKEALARLGDRSPAATATPSSSSPPPTNLPTGDLKTLLEEGRAAYNAKNYEKAYPYFYAATLQGHADACFHLGMMYDNGYGVTPDRDQAVSWFRKAAEQGYAPAIEALARLEGGQPPTVAAVPQPQAPQQTATVETPQQQAQTSPSPVTPDIEQLYSLGLAASDKEDYAEAYGYFRKAAEAGHTDAQNILGIMHFHGLGVSQDYDQAVFWHRKAADQGYVAAQFNLSYLYFNIFREFDQAAFWFHKAAEQGYAPAQLYLGGMYNDGLGVPEDRAQAVYWFSKAAEQGNQEAIEALRLLGVE